jgi:periodic tryptophan protein 2
VTHNRSLEGVLDQLNSKNITDAGPLQLINHDDADSDDELLPAAGDLAAAADVPGTSTKKRPMARTRALALSPTGATWAAATTEGLIIYALDTGLVFDPTDLTEKLTPAAFHQAVAGRGYVRALLIALRLGDAMLLRHGLLSVPPGQVVTVAAQLPVMFLQPLLVCLVDCLEASPHMEFLLSWSKALLVSHGSALAAAAGGATALRAAVVGTGSTGAAAAAAAGGDGGSTGGGLVAALRALQQIVNRLHKDLSSTAEGNKYLLDYIVAAGRLQQQQQQQQQDPEPAAADNGLALQDVRILDVQQQQQNKQNITPGKKKLKKKRQQGL